MYFDVYEQCIEIGIGYENSSVDGEGGGGGVVDSG